MICIQELHRDDVLAEAPGWKRPVWKHGGLGSAPEGTPSRIGRCASQAVSKTSPRIDMIRGLGPARYSPPGGGTLEIESVLSAGFVRGTASPSIAQPDVGQCLRGRITARGRAVAA